MPEVLLDLFSGDEKQRWGKWRPSAEAVRLGPVAVRMEVLAHEGAPFDEICRSLRDNFKVDLSQAELAKIWKRLPPPTPRRFEGEELLEGISSRDPGPEARLLREERRRIQGRILEALRRARAQLPSEDNLIVKLRFESGWTFANISKYLHLEQRRFTDTGQTSFMEHPESEDLAAYIEGQLSPSERNRIAGHLASCEDCYEVFTESIRALEEDAPGEDTRVGGPRPLPFLTGGQG